jgi:hypothetical protein
MGTRYSEKMRGAAYYWHFRSQRAEIRREISVSLLNCQDQRQPLQCDSLTCYDICYALLYPTIVSRTVSRFVLALVMLLLIGTLLC